MAFLQRTHDVTRGCCIKQQKSCSWATSARVQRAGDGSCRPGFVQGCRIEGNLAWQPVRGGEWSLCCFAILPEGTCWPVCSASASLSVAEENMFLITSRGDWLPPSCSVMVHLIGPGEGKCRVLLSEELFFVQSRLAAWLPTLEPWGFISLTVFTLAKGLDAAFSLLNPNHVRIALIYLHKCFSWRATGCIIVVSRQSYLCAV